ncbi:putative shc transforming protein [Schistosoma mansoni]|uniref:putative shc transforming protein n=1 Tax=Schistosoma mansoni TaxID=6183 RepID=UPI0001A627A3|nr:putative shc transforming protein [Schistosoma mansoni]|eukprot:XP_018649179.1 putative shc transforming protein [Schistosoma mansoni]
MYRWTVLFLLLSPALCLFNTNDDVIKLTDQNFDKVISSKELWFIMFYASWCGHSKNAAPDWKLFATNFKGIIKVAAVDSENNPTVTQRFSVKGFPTILIFGDNKNSPKPYTGGRDIDHLNKEALRELTSLVKTRTGSGSSDGSDKDDVIELTDSNFDEKVLNSQEPWLVEFFAPWCGHCKNLKPHWDKAARELKGTVKVAALDATVHSRMAQKYGIRGYPTIKFFPAGPKTDDPIDYDGARSSDAIVAWAMEKADASAPAPEIVELTSATLKHSDLENVLDIGGSGYPAMVAVHGRKKKRTTLRGAYSSTGVHDFLRQLSVGGSNLPLYDVSSLPEIKTVEAWDGKDAPPTEEQDYDDLKVEL